LHQRQRHRDSPAGGSRDGAAVLARGRRAFPARRHASSREWIQVNRENAADYASDLDLFKSSIEFVKGGR
jgi:hypothetical protein